MSEVERLRKLLAVYREIFDEITLKAKPLCEDESDPERVTGYQLPVGPIHRAAGRVNHHMLGIAVNVERSVELLRKWEPSEECKRDIAEIERNMATALDRINKSGWPYDIPPASDQATALSKES